MIDELPLTETISQDRLLLRQLVKDVVALQEEVKALRSELEKTKESQQ